MADYCWFTRCGSVENKYILYEKNTKYRCDLHDSQKYRK